MEHHAAENDSRNERDSGPASQTVNTFNDQLNPRPRVWQPFASDATTSLPPKPPDLAKLQTGTSPRTQRFLTSQDFTAANTSRLKGSFHASCYGGLHFYHHETLRYMYAMGQNYGANLLEEWRAAVHRMFDFVRYDSEHLSISDQNRRTEQKTLVCNLPTASDSKQHLILAATPQLANPVDKLFLDRCSITNSQISTWINPKFDEGITQTCLGFPTARFPSRHNNLEMTREINLNPPATVYNDWTIDLDPKASQPEIISTTQTSKAKVIHCNINGSPVVGNSVNLPISPYECHQCGKEYSSQPAFAMHLRTHSRNSVCPFCGKRFSRPWLLQGHLRTHTGEKPYSCDMCSKSFADKSNLRAHQQTHSGLKPHVCRRCGKAFALKSYLYKHEESSCIKNVAGVQRRHYPQRAQVTHRQQIGCIKLPAFVHFQNSF